MKFIFAFLFFLGVFFILPKSVSADYTSPQAQGGSQSWTTNSVHHAYKPYQSGQQMTATVNNSTQVSQSKLVCVEAYNNANWNKTHLGCLWVNVAPMGQEGWGYQFNVPMGSLANGKYTVMYSYQESDGSWHGVKSAQMHVWNGTYQAW